MNEEYDYNYKDNYARDEYREETYSIYPQHSAPEKVTVSPTKTPGRVWAVILSFLAVILLLLNSFFLWQMGEQNKTQYLDLNDKIASLQEQVSGDGHGGDLFDTISAFNTIKDSVVFVECSTGLFGYNVSGSGWIISSNGYIVTCQHVIQGARSIRVTLNSGQKVDATVYASDFNRDIAVLKITPPNGVTLKAAKLAQSNPVQAQPLLVVGYPESYNIGSDQMSVFFGVCSAVKKMTNSNQSRYSYDYIQSDAAMNSGNSGGPVINLKGEVVGMVSWGFDFSMMEGVGFALACSEIRLFLASNGINV